MGSTNIRIMPDRTQGNPSHTIIQFRTLLNLIFSLFQLRPSFSTITPGMLGCYGVNLDVDGIG